MFERHVRRKGSSINGLCSCGIGCENCPLLALWYDSGLDLSCEVRGGELELVLSSLLVEYTEALVERGILAAARMQGSSILPLDTNWRLLDSNIVAQSGCQPSQERPAPMACPFEGAVPRSHTTKKVSF